MDVIDSRVRKCITESYLTDKKLRKRTIKFEKFIIPLNSNNPFDEGEFVKILRKSDFEKIGEVIKKIKEEREHLMEENKKITLLLESQRNYIASLENSNCKKNNDSNLIELIKNSL